MDFLKAPRALHRWAVALLVANMAIIVTGGLVRVTGSGLGCSTWPQCEPGSYLPHPEAGGHAFIEFGNRTLTFVLVLIALGTFLSAWRSAKTRHRPGSVALSIGIGVGIIAQAVIGGISVLTNLNPWVVAAHLLPSIGLVAASVVLVRISGERPGIDAGPRVRGLIRMLTWLGILAMLLGAVVTGAGPNSGDGGAQRNGLDLALTSRLHAGAVWAVVALTISILVLSRSNAALRRPVILLLGTEILQGIIGYTQYVLALPWGLVAAHMAGTTLFTAALADLWWLTSRAARNQLSSGSTAAAKNTTAR